MAEPKKDPKKDDTAKKENEQAKRFVKEVLGMSDKKEEIDEAIKKEEEKKKNK